LLANVLLDDLDKELERRGYRFVRYADDFGIYVRSERAAVRALETATRFLEVKLRLKVNRVKSAAAPSSQALVSWALRSGKPGTRLRFESRPRRSFASGTRFGA